MKILVCYEIPTAKGQLVADAQCDIVALTSEHLSDIRRKLFESHESDKPAGRLIFRSVTRLDE